LIAADTSALMAIFLNEEDSLTFERAIFQAREVVIAAPTAFEFVMVAQGRVHPSRGADADPWRLLSRSRLRIEPWTEAHVAIAEDAFRRYGKGQGHPAQLNFGDCMSYALAKALDVPLLYKGGDFAQTDIAAAV